MGIISDVAEELKKLNQDPKTLRKFGLTIASAMSILGLLVFVLGSHVERSYWLWGVGLLFLFVGLVQPNFLRPIHKSWMGLAFVLGWFVSRFLLSVIFFGAVSPIAIIMKILKKDPLSRKIDRNAESYWIKREENELTPQKYEKLY